MNKTQFFKKIQKLGIEKLDIYFDKSVDEYAYNIDIYAGQIDIAFQNIKSKSDFQKFVFWKIERELKNVL